MSSNAVTTARQVSVREALTLGLRDEMRRDGRVFVMGEDVRAGTLGLTSGLHDEFGDARVRNCPISEAATVGLAVGAAMCGMRPFVDLNIASFSYLAMDQLVNQAAKNRFLFGGQFELPVVFHLCHFHRSKVGAQHTDRPHPMLMGVPGIKIVAPASPADAVGLMRSAIRDNDPVVLFGDITVWNRRGEVPTDPDFTVPLGEAEVVREGSDVTIVAIFSRYECLDAAGKLAERGIQAEVIDPRTLVPLDHDTILGSVRRTGRLVVVDTAHRTCSAASEVAALVAEQAFDDLVAPIVRVTTPDVHIPVAAEVERQLFPTVEKVIAAAEQVMEHERARGGVR